MNKTLTCSAWVIEPAGGQSNILLDFEYQK